MKRHKLLPKRWTFMVRFSALMLIFLLAEPALCLPADKSVFSLKSDSETLKTTIISVDGDYQTAGDIYYVSVNGSDGNPGTEAQPFRTISKAVTVLELGDTLYIREGIYHEKVQIHTSGSPGNPITISAYPGEHPVIDAQNTLPGQLHDYLIILRGDYITLTGLEIRNVYGLAVYVRGSFNTVRDMRIHHCMQEGILVAGSGGSYCANGPTNSHNVVEDNEIWMASLRHEGIVTSGGSWTAGISVARCPEYTIVRRNIVYNNWGMGIQVFEAYNTTIEDNITWNNQRTHYYINNAPYTTLQRNISYNTSDTTFLYKDTPGVSIALADERSAPVSHHIRIVNNLTLGGAHGVFFFNQYAGSGLKHSVIANNTFVDSYSVGITVQRGDHENTKIYNNIVSGDGTVALAPDDPELDFSHNLWPVVPPNSVSSDNDVIGNPHLAKTGSTAAGLLDPHWFELLSYSPAIDSGITLSDVYEDFAHVARPRGTGYDMGAYEFTNYITDFQITDAVVNMPEITYTMRWTAPAGAVTYGLRRSDFRITLENWDAAVEVSVPFTPSAPGTTEWLTTSVPYSGDIVYFALRFQNSVGDWSELSNNGFWPTKNVYLPIVYQKNNMSRINSGTKQWDRQTNCFSWAMLLCLTGYIMHVSGDDKVFHE